MTSIAALSDIHLLPEAYEQIEALVGERLNIPQDSLESEAELVARTGGAEAILVSPGTKITASYLDACSSVKYIGLCGSSTGNIDLDALASRDIALTNVVDYGDEPTAEFIFMQLLSLIRGTGPYQWRPEPHELMGKPIGIIGLGALGKAIANVALAFKMEVGYYSPHRKTDWEERGLGYKPLTGLLLASRIIVISAPSNTNVLGAQEFAAIPPNSILIQASLGDMFDRDAFLDWIAQDGNFALFDYAAGERNYQAYNGLPRVVFPKIVAGHTYETKQRLGERVVENLTRYLVGRHHGNPSQFGE